MNFKTTIALVVLLVFVGVAYLLTRHTPGSDVVEERRRAPIDRGGLPVFSAEELPTESVTTLTLDRGGEKIVITRDGEAWRQAEPVSFPISTWQGKTLIDKAATLRYSDRFAAGKDGNPSLADTGLDTPAATVKLDLPERDGQPARQHVIKFGRALAGSAYVQINDDPHVYAVSADVHSLFVEGKPTDWRSRSLNAPTEGQVHRIAMTRDSESIELTKTDGRWMLDPARGDRADVDAVTGLLTGIGGLYISEFIADAPADLAMYGLATPRLQIVVEAADKTTTIDIGGPVDLARESFFATWRDDETARPVVFSLTKTGLDRFEKPIDDLRDKRLTIARATEVNEVHIERGGEPALHVTKMPQGWAFAEPGPGYDVDSTAVTELLGAIFDARATAFAAEVPAETPAIKVTLNLVGGKAPERLSVWPHTHDDAVSWLVLRDGEKTGYIVPRDRLDPLRKPVVSLRDREVLALAPDQIAAITVERGDGVFALRRERTGEAWGSWTLNDAEPLESAAAEALVNASAPLRAEVWLAPEQVEGDMKLTLTPQAGESVTLTVNTQTRVASGPWTEGVIVLPPTLLDAAKAEFRHRTVLALKAQDIASVTLARGEMKVTLERDASGRYTRSDGGDVNEADAAGLFDTLAGLRCERFFAENQAGVDSSVPSTLTLQLTDGTARRLTLWPPSQNDLRLHLGRIDDQPRVFSLTEQAVEKLVKLLDNPENAGAD